MSRFNTNIGVMDTAAGRVDTVNDEITGLLRKVADSVDALSGTVWTGAGQARFAVIMSNWQQQSIKLNDALSGIAQTLRSNSSFLDSADQDSAAQLSRVAANGPLKI